MTWFWSGACVPEQGQELGAPLVNHGPGWRFYQLSRIWFRLHFLQLLENNRKKRWLYFTLQNIHSFRFPRPCLSSKRRRDKDAWEISSFDIIFWWTCTRASKVTVYVMLFSNFKRKHKWSCFKDLHKQILGHPKRGLGVYQFKTQEKYMDSAKENMDLVGR